MHADDTAFEDSNEQNATATNLSDQADIDALKDYEDEEGETPSNTMEENTNLVNDALIHSNEAEDNSQNTPNPFVNTVPTEVWQTALETEVATCN
jgi:hypothetical protein